MHVSLLYGNAGLIHCHMPSMYHKNGKSLESVFPSDLSDAGRNTSQHHAAENLRSCTCPRDISVAVIAFLLITDLHSQKATGSLTKRNRILLSQKRKKLSDGMSTSMNVSPLVLAIHHNNEGACRINKGAYASAISELLAALRFIKKAMNKSSYKDAASTVMHQHSTLETEPFSYEFETEVESTSFSTRFVYKYPLQIRWESANECRDSCNKAASTIVFNLALVHHLRAMHTADPRTISRNDDLNKSVCFYEKAYVLQLNEKCGESGIRAMATLNNLAHVNHLQHNEYRARQCWQMLLSLIVLVTDACSTNNNNGDLSCFLGSVTHLILRQAESAPAA